MSRSNAFFLLFSFVIAFGFLWSTNQSLNKDFRTIEAEINHVGKKIYVTEEQQLEELKDLSKQKTSYSNLIPDYLELKKKTLLDLKTDGLITKEIYNENLTKLESKDNQYMELALQSDSPTLSKLYTQMALSQYLKELINSISPPNKNLKYTSELVTINEPKSYHIGSEYPIYFDLINKIEAPQSDQIKIVHNEAVIPYSKFPLVFDKPQQAKQFLISPMKNNALFQSGVIKTRNHDITHPN